MSVAPNGETRNGDEGAATKAGNYFISNYPPYSFWTPEHVPAALGALERSAPADTELTATGTPLGLYVHLPFCRKRCDFCYFKVYTDKASADIRRYLDVVLRELELYAARPAIAGRKPRFVYFGGGTPSYLSSEQLRTLFEGLRSILPWDAAREIAFECEPGTLQEGKVDLLRELGVTRLSLGVENFDADILELNNRAHRAKEIERAWRMCRDAGFDQINVDLIAGMVGETEENWRQCIERTIELDPESVTLYQMEVPFNTTLYRDMQDGAKAVAPVADWETKRRWVREGFARLEQEGYEVGSAYTASKGANVSFLYRDELWHGADLLSLGVSSFSHLGGVHFQNEHSFEPYCARVEAGELPILRALPLEADERLIREFVLQMKLGHLDTAYFADKFGVDVTERFAVPLARHVHAGWLELAPGEIRATREGLLRIDELLPDFFLERHQGARYA